mgnify:FL=1
MAGGKKMALIPLDMLHRINKPDLSQLKNPTQDQLVKTVGEMSNVLHDNSLPDDIKSSRFNEKIRDFTIYADKITTPATTPITKHPAHQTFHSLPKTFQQPANILLSELQKHPERVQWDNNELTIDGKRMVGSNLVDLVGDVLRNRKTVSAPMYSDDFLQLLADMNVPEELIRNKYRLAKFRSLKGNSLSTPPLPALSRKLDILKQRREKSARIRKSKLQKKTQAYKWANV